MHAFLRRRRAAAILLLTVITSFSLAVDPAWAAGSVPAAVYAYQAGWTKSGTFTTSRECAAAGMADPGGRKWKCVESATQSGGFDLYFWI
jgi:hypothetical protein